MHHFIQHVLYEMVLSRAGFQAPPCFSGMVDNKTADQQACDTLFSDDTIAGLNWLHGTDPHLLQAFSQLQAGLTREDIRKIIHHRSWSHFFDKPTTSFAGLKVVIQLSRGWSPFYQTYTLKTQSNPVMNKPTLLNHSLLLGSWSQTLSEVDAQNDLSALGFLTGLKPGVSSVDGAYYDINALKALENAFRIAYLQDIDEYFQLVFNGDFSGHIIYGIENLQAHSQSVSSKAHDTASRYFSKLQNLLDQWHQNGQQTSKSIRNQLIRETLLAMSYEGHFPTRAAIPLIMARREQLLNSGAVILKETPKYVISHPATPSPQQRAYQKKLFRLLAEHNLKLVDITRDGNCMFTALETMFGVKASSLRTKLIMFLKKLRYKIRNNKPLSSLEYTYWVQNGYDEDWLNHEIHMMEGGGWGGVHTLGPLIAMISFDVPSIEGLTVLLPHGPGLVIWQILPDGSIQEQPTLTQQLPILVQDGINHWMVTEEDHPSGNSPSNHTTQTGQEGTVSYTPGILGRLLRGTRF